MSDENKKRQKTAHIRDFKNRHRHNHRRRPACVIGGGELSKEDRDMLEHEIANVLNKRQR